MTRSVRPSGNHGKNTLLLIAILSFSAIATLAVGNHQILPAAHAANSNNIVGINCALGTIDPVTGATFTGRDGNWSSSGISSVERTCQWLGDTGGLGTPPVAGQTEETSAEPLVTDPAPNNTAVSCTTAPCGAPGGGGFEADIIITNLNDSITGFDLNVSYDPTILNAVVIDQAGLEFGANAGCSSCTIPLVSAIDNGLGHVRVAQALRGTSAGTVGGTVALFRVRFDVVGAGRSAITVGGLDRVIHSISGVAGYLLPHVDVPAVFRTDAFYDLLVNGCPTSASCKTSGLGFNASWTYSPNPPVPGSPITFTATSACKNCTGGFSYSWAFNTSEFAVPAVLKTGATVTLNTPFPTIARVTLIVKDSASPVPNNVTVTRLVPLGAAIYGPSTLSTGASGSWTGWWTGGILPYTTGKWQLCPSPGTSPNKICTTPSISFAPPSTRLQNSTTSGVSYNFDGLYRLSIQIGDSSPTWATSAVTATTVVTPIFGYFPLNVTGSTPVFTVSSSPNVTATDIGRGVSLSASVLYNNNYPSSAQVTSFNYTAYFGDGSSLSSIGGPSSQIQPLVHVYNTPGTYTIRITAQENNPSKAVNSITETTYSTITIASAPTATFSYGPTSPTNGQSVTFTATVSSGTGPYTYYWSFGDGTTATGSSASHTYTSTGSYNVTLTITDASNVNATYSKMISVSSAPSSPSSSTPYLYIGIGAAIAVVAASAFLLMRRRKRSTNIASSPPPKP